jgi:hypothetical protein
VLPPSIIKLAGGTDILIHNTGQSVSTLHLNQDMERMFRNFSDYWTDSKKTQPVTPGGAVIHISSRFLVAALWFIGITVAVSLYFFYQIILAGIGVKK